MIRESKDYKNGRNIRNKRKLSDLLKVIPLVRLISATIQKFCCIIWVSSTPLLLLPSLAVVISDFKGYLEENNYRICKQ